ncbi:MAG TPA: 50S ribosomal protein L29 [Blastocatellia bacterium]|nr:50S ribosomal protein L29 [Blastocatellia bacterium]
MKTGQWREMSEEELRAQEATLRESIFRLKFKLSLGEVEALKNLRQAKKDLARVLTILRERQRKNVG